MGPDLEKATTKRTNEELVDALLRPSKLIDKDYAQVSVLTADGQIFTGIRVSENDDEIVLRNLAQPEPITIAQDDVEDVIESEVSLMPENLMRQMKNRKEFNDLLKYVIEVRKK